MNMAEDHKIPALTAGGNKEADIATPTSDPIFPPSVGVPGECDPTAWYSQQQGDAVELGCQSRVQVLRQEALRRACRPEGQKCGDVFEGCARRSTLAP